MRMMPTHYSGKAEPLKAKKAQLETAHVLPPLQGLSMANTLTQGNANTATILSNFVIEDDSIVCRAGYRKTATRGTQPVWCLVPWYGAPNALAAASNGELWDAQNGNRIKGGFTSNNWHWTSFSNLGEYDYTVMVNGADGVWSWNGNLTDDIYGDIPGTNLTSANPAVVTVGAGDIGKFALDQVVFVSGAAGPGTVKANGYRKITAKSGNNLTLNVDTLGGTTQASGVKLNPSTGIIKEDVTCPTATWVSPNTMQIVVAHMNRLFFADNNNLAIYYLPLQQKSGALKVFPLNAVFRRGGHIRAMYTWTIDGGAGMDDQLVIFSTNGECVIYKGLDPDTDFQLVGIYRFDSPMSKHSVAQYGGELYVLISTGLVPLSTMMRAETERLGQSDRGVTSLFLANAIAYRSDPGWQTFLNPSSGRMICSLPQGAPNRYRQMVRHMPKPTWTSWAGIPARCWNWLDPFVFFGDDSGNVYEMHPMHLSDGGKGIRVDVQMAWNNFKTTSNKHFKGITTYYSSNGDVHPSIDVKTGYDSSLPENTPDIGDTAVGADWNTAIWNQAEWAHGDRALSVWNGVKSSGHVGAVRVTAVLTNASFGVNGWDVEFEKGVEVNVSFAPLKADAIDYLSSGTGIDFGPSAPFAPTRWFCVTARNGDGDIMGVIASEGLSWFEGSFHSVVTDPHCATRRLLRAVFTALFSQVVRLTALIDPGNARAIRNATAMGFIVEGLCRRGLDGRRDALTFGMLKSDCKMLGHRRATPHAFNAMRMSLHG